MFLVGVLCIVVAATIGCFLQRWHTMVRHLPPTQLVGVLTAAVFGSIICYALGFTMVLVSWYPVHQAMVLSSIIGYCFAILSLWRLRLLSENW